MKKTDQGYIIDGITIAPGVVETIISLAAAEVPGVAGVGSADTISSIFAAFNAGNAVPTNGINVQIDEDEVVTVDIDVRASYGSRLVDIAESVRSAIADALIGQIGVEVAQVNVHIEALSFEE